MRPKPYVFCQLLFCGGLFYCLFAGQTHPEDSAEGVKLFVGAGVFMLLIWMTFLADLILMKIKELKK